MNLVSSDGILRPGELFEDAIQSVITGQEFPRFYAENSQDSFLNPGVGGESTPDFRFICGVNDEESPMNAPISQGASRDDEPRAHLGINERRVFGP
jgi:hypothetical protein